MKVASKFLGFVCALILAWPLCAQHFPTLTGYVVDEAGILTEQERQEMTQRLRALSPRQVVVATVTSLDGYNIDYYANQLFRHWQLGNLNRNDGVLILLAPHERFIRIEVGYGLEDVLTDALSSQIIHKKMIPLAKQNQFGPALQAGVNAVADILSGVSPDFSTHDGSGFPVYVFLFCFIVFFMTPFLIYLQTLSYFKKNSTPNRVLFFTYVIGSCCFYLPFFIPIIFIPLLGIFLLAFISLHAYFMYIRSALSAWEKDPLFPFNEFVKNVRMFGGRGGHHSGHGFSSGGFGGGGGGFGGGGGSSGGGGASGGF